MIAVLLLAFGGPATLDEVEFFLTSVMSGRKPSTEQLEKVKERYKFILRSAYSAEAPVLRSTTKDEAAKAGTTENGLIGGSPLPGITLNQAKLLEEKLNKDFRGMNPAPSGARVNQSGSYRVYVGFRHSHPTIEETVNQIVKDEIKNIVVLSLAPYYSKVTTAGYIAELERVIKKNQANFKITVGRHLATHPLYLECIVEKIEQGLKKFPAEERNEVQIIFSVHSIPQKFIDKGDPYLDQVKVSIDGIIKISGLSNWQLAFQSRGMHPAPSGARVHQNGSYRGLGEDKWLEPEVKTVLDNLAEKKVKNVLLVPLSFISDNLEILYDIDVVYRDYAESKGMRFFRSETLNLTPKFIEVLAEIVHEFL